MSDDISLSARPRRAPASCAAMPAPCCAASGPAAPAPATATPTRTASWCASIRWCCWPSPTWRASAFVEGSAAWRGELGKGEGAFVTGIGATTTYPDYKPAPFIVVVEARRRRHGHRRDRGHLQLLRREGEDRHRPLSRARAGGRAREGRGGGPRHHGGIRLADAVAGRRASPDGRQQEGGRRHLRGAAGAVQPRGRRARDRRRRDGGGAGRQAADRQRHARGAHAGGLRLGRHRHVRAAMEGPCRRGDRGRRPHHRRAERAPGRPLPRHEAGRHPGARPPLDAGPLFPGGRAGPGLGRHRRHRSAGDHREDRSQDGLAGPAAADGLDHRRAFGLVRARQRPEAAARRDARSRCATSSSASPRIASRRCAPCCSWRAPAARCAPA